jgi:hypothetical protein
VAEPVLQLGDLGQQQLASGDGVDQGTVGQVARQPEVLTRGVEAQRAGPDLAVLGEHELMLQCHGVDRGERQSGAVRLLRRALQEAQLDGCMVGEQHPALQRGEQVGEYADQAGGRRHRVVGEPVHRGRFAHVDPGRRPDQHLAGAGQHDLPDHHRHPADGEDVIASRVQAGCLEVHCQELDH